MKTFYNCLVDNIAGEPFSYEVSSRSEDLPHRVNMTERDGMGVCTCNQFKFRCEKNWQILQELVPYAEDADGCPYNPKSATECRHIAACRMMIYEWFMQPLLHSCRHGITEEIRRAVQQIIVGHDPGEC